LRRRALGIMSSHEDDLDLLLSLQDRVPDTPPSSPTAGYLSDDESSKQREKPDMSVFKNAVQDCLPYDPPKVSKPSNTPVTNDSQLDKFSGLRIRNQLLTPAELREHFSDIRFVRLSVIKNSLIGDTFSGSWATVGVLTEKGSQKTSSSGKSFCIWKIGCLDENTVSLFLFGDAYQKNMQEQAGTVFALFNCTVRKDTVVLNCYELVPFFGNGFSLSIYSTRQIMKMGISADYGVCKGKRTDGMACTLVINKYTNNQKASEKYSTMRSELNGGNLKTAFRPRNYLKSEGIYLVDPLADKTNLKKSRSVKLLSVDDLRKALSKAGKVTTTTHSQGIRFLSEVAGKSEPKMENKGPKIQNEQNKCSEKRKSSFSNVGSSAVMRNRQLDVKRMKPDEQILADKTPKSTEKMIELDF
ncbi:Protein MCM10-like protein, partial [Mucuna pruriens]